MALGGMRGVCACGVCGSFEERPVDDGGVVSCEGFQLMAVAWHAPCAVHCSVRIVVG